MDASLVSKPLFYLQNQSLNTALLDAARTISGGSGNIKINLIEFCLIMKMPLLKLDLIRKSFRASLLFGVVVFIFNPASKNFYGQSVSARNPVGFIEQGESARVKVFALRLKPGQDLRKEIENFAKQKAIKAGFIVTTVGSLEKTALRLADQNESNIFDGKFEIVSLVGTISPDGIHLHLSVSDNTGRTIGGHLVEGCRIYTTAEIIIGEAEGLLFARETDKLTGYKELRIRSKEWHPKRSKTP